MMGRISISLPKLLLEEVEKRASALGMTRSDFLQEAATRYIDSIDAEDAARARTQRLSRVRDQMRSVSHAVGAPNAEETIRQMRDEAGRF